MKVSLVKDMIVQKKKIIITISVKWLGPDLLFPYIFEISVNGSWYSDEVMLCVCLLSIVFQKKIIIITTTYK